MSFISQVLVVDDNESICKSLKLILDRTGYTVTTANTGKGALIEAKTTEIQIALVDMQLPDMDGLDLLVKLIELYPQISVMIITGHSSKETAIRAIENGALAYIEKPIEIDALLETLAQIVEKKRISYERELKDGENAIKIRESEIYVSLLKHDLRNDLQVIMGYLETAIALNEMSNIEIDELLKSGLAAAERMDYLINVMSKSVSEERSDVIISLIERVSALAKRTHKGMRINIHGETDKQLRTQSCRLLPLVFENIFRNSAEHAKESPTIEITVTRNETNIEIVIADDGPGIPSEIKSVLFQRGTSTTGGGLGLYLSKRIIESIGGQIELASSKTCKGAVFRIVLPIELKTM
ncbi:MAG: response regulator [Candidatus Thorarchaeota archaeon]